MPETVLFAERHLTLHPRASLPDADLRASRRVLNGQAFTAAVRQAVLTVARARPELKPVRLTLGRGDVSISLRRVGRAGF